MLFLDSKSLKSPETLLATLDRFLTTDDVFSEDFLSDIVVTNVPASDNFTAHKALTHCKPGDWNPHTIITLSTFSMQNPPTEGPYFLLGRALYQAWRLYPDRADAFATTFVPTAADPYQYVTPSFASNLGTR